MKNSWSVNLVTLHLSEAMQHNFVLKSFTDCRLTTNSQSNENHNHHAWTYHSTKTSTQPRLTQSSKSIPHTLNQTTSPPLFPFTLKQVLETHEPSLFQPLRSHSNQHKVSQLPQVRSLIVWSSLNTSLSTSLRLQIPWTCSPPTPHIYSTFPIRGVFRTQAKICNEAFLAKIVNVLKSLIILAEKLHNRCSIAF